MSSLKQRHTLTLDPDCVRRADRLRAGQSLSSFVNDAIVAYTAVLERKLYEVIPPTLDEDAWARTAANKFVGEDDEDWDALLPEIPEIAGS
jgi:hypothetical protein